MNRNSIRNDNFWAYSLILLIISLVISSSHSLDNTQEEEMLVISKPPSSINFIGDRLTERSPLTQQPFETSPVPYFKQQVYYDTASLALGVYLSVPLEDWFLIKIFGEDHPLKSAAVAIPLVIYFAITYAILLSIRYSDLEINTPPVTCAKACSIATMFALWASGFFINIILGRNI